MRHVDRGGSAAGTKAPEPPQGSQAPETPQTPDPSQSSDKSLVLFGSRDISNLPAQVQDVMRKYKTRTLPGVAPSWKPDKEGDTIAGLVTQYREGVGQFNQSLVVIETPEGPKSVWLGADLKLKLGAQSIGKPHMIVYEGTRQVGKGRGQPMKCYQVIEVLGVTDENPK